MSRPIAVSMAGLAVCVAAVPASATNIYCTVTGATQGVFTGSSTDDKHRTEIPVLAFSEEVTAGTEGFGGSGAGRITTQPFTITKTIDATSVQFFLAAVKAENIRSVVCALLRDTDTGEVQTYFRITLRNARITDLKDSGDGLNGSARGDDRERITFAYQTIELQDLDSNTTAIGGGQ